MSGNVIYCYNELVRLAYPSDCDNENSGLFEIVGAEDVARIEGNIILKNGRDRIRAMENMTPSDIQEGIIEMGKLSRRVNRARRVIMHLRNFGYDDEEILKLGQEGKFGFDSGMARSILEED